LPESETRSAVFARQVRRLREERGWSQGELVRRLAEAGHPVGQSRVSTIEAPGPEPRTVTLDQAQAFADAFGVALERLVLEDWPVTRDVMLRELVNLLDQSDLDLARTVESANEVREMAVRFLRKYPGSVPAGMTERLPQVEIRRGSAAKMKQDAAKQRREHDEPGEG
jgi:transcriptional regulator with XRE-family HTH domain